MKALGQALIDVGVQHGPLSINSVLPSAKSIGRFTETVFCGVKTKLIEELSSVKFLSVSTDHWSDKFKHCSFLGLTVQYVLDNQVMNRALAVRSSSSKCCQDTANQSYAILAQFGIEVSLQSSLKQHCDTRWDTRYFMLQSVMDNWTEISQCVHKSIKPKVDRLDLTLLTDLTVTPHHKAASFLNPLFKSSKVFTEEDKAEAKRMIVDVYNDLKSKGQLLDYVNSPDNCSSKMSSSIWDSCFDEESSDQESSESIEEELSKYSAKVKLNSDLCDDIDLSKPETEENIEESDDEEEEEVEEEEILDNINEQEFILMTGVFCLLNSTFFVCFNKMILFDEFSDT
ncbi:hypothetical protein TYRP_021361 [Tyrophagus putrescentiae]|nr:hypothetical protein TYRP_021361 [Tyrophagus putrescentiae]